MKTKPREDWNCFFKKNLPPFIFSWKASKCCLQTIPLRLNRNESPEVNTTLQMIQRKHAGWKTWDLIFITKSFSFNLTLQPEHVLPKILKMEWSKWKRGFNESWRTGKLMHKIYTNKVRVNTPVSVNWREFLCQWRHKIKKLNIHIKMGNLLLLMAKDFRFDCFQLKKSSEDGDLASKV